MKALILAAGYGTRLEPLTLAVPKPMAPIVNLPTMQHNIELLRRYGFNEIIANIHYYPEQIENYFGDGETFGVNLSYSYEEELMGTAGGVKRMAQIIGLEDTILVLSSDALTDIDIEEFLRFHKDRKALASIALSKVEDVSRFGVVVKGKDNVITAFQEKPEREEVKSTWVNTGIYLFEPQIIDKIPEGFCDFGRQIFPEMAAKKEEIYGYEMAKYWSDVGSLDKYIQANFDALNGAIRIKIPGKKIDKSLWIGDRVVVFPSAKFEGAVMVGNACRIGKNALIRNSIIGDKCIIGDDAEISGSVIWSDTVIGEGTRIEQSVLGNWCHVGKKVKIGEGTVIANRCLVRNSTVVPPQSRFNPDSVV